MIDTGIECCRGAVSSGESSPDELAWDTPPDKLSELFRKFDKPFQSLLEENNPLKNKSKVESRKSEVNTNKDATVADTLTGSSLSTFDFRLPNSFNGISLFSGIGGFELGLRLAGLEDWVKVRQFVEINPYCQKVLQKNFSGVPIHDDIRTYDPTGIDGSRTIVFGGFPCQPHSVAGKKKAESDERDLWPELYRIICQVRPRWIVLENVPGLFSSNAGRFFRGILWDLAKIGYDTEWSIVSVSEVGGVHKRERVFVIAYPNSLGRDNCCNSQRQHPDLLHQKWYAQEDKQPRGEWLSGTGAISPTYAPDSQGTGRAASGSEKSQAGADAALVSSSTKLAHTNSKRLEARECSASRLSDLGESARSSGCDDWETETQPSVRRGNDGVSPQLDSTRRGQGDYLLRHPELERWLPHATDTDNIPHRRERIEALGNSVCPNAAAIAWRRVAYLAGWVYT